MIACAAVYWYGPRTLAAEAGDTNCTFLSQAMHNLSPRVGAYAEYVGGVDVGIMKIPDDWSFEEASSLGIGIATVGLALFHNLQVPGYPDKPAAEPKTVLVYGGSTAAGTLALQMLRL